MQIANELEELADDSRSTQFAQLKLQSKDLILQQPCLGANFIMGRAGTSLCFVPLTSVLEIIGLENAPQRSVSFDSVLSAQQEPIKIHYQLPESLSTGWLLTVSEPWLRLAHPQGVIWVPISRVIYAEIPTPKESWISK